MEKDIMMLLEKCIETKDTLEGFSNGDLLDLADLCSNDCGFFYRVYAAVNEGVGELADEAAGVFFEGNDGAFEISFNDRRLCFTKAQLLAYLSLAIDIAGEVLPLGSVVDLKKEFFKDSLPVDKVDTMRFVISHRFIYVEGDSFYFPYAGMVYPVGAMGQERYVNFTAPLIDSIVFRGYSDEQDKAFVYMMKEELVAKNHMSSFTFATKEDTRRFQQAASERQGQDGRY